MGRVTNLEEVIVALKVDRVSTRDGKTEYIIGRTPGLRIDSDLCIHIDESIVEGMGIREV